MKASVHCVIIGFSNKSDQAKEKVLYDELGTKKIVKNISPYLIDADDIIIDKQSHVISNVPQMVLGSMAKDGGGFILSEEEYKEFTEDEPQSLKYIRRFMMGREFINNIPRYCLWLVNANPSDLRNCPMVLNRIGIVRKYRLSSKAPSTKAIAETPMLFAQIAQPSSEYIAIPKVSSCRRRYIPIGYLSPDIIAGDKLFIVPNATLFHFGVLTSSVHNSWMRLTAGRLKSDYSYNSTTVYNTFPWPLPSEQQKEKISETAQGVIDARALFPNSSLADLYDPLTMPIELRKAHEANDKAVMDAYGFSKDISEADIVAELMKRYLQITQKR